MSQIKRKKGERWKEICYETAAGRRRGRRGTGPLEGRRQTVKRKRVMRGGSEVEDEGVQ